MRAKATFLATFFIVLFSGAAAANAACNGLTATITGTSSAEVITGTSGNDVIEALAGDDTINGGGGNDTICAGDGYDTINPGSGTDWVDGGLGGNVLDYSAVAAAMTVNLATGSATGDGTDTISNVSDVYGSTSFADLITGNTLNNFLVGWGGDDVIVGAAGADFIQGGDGNDALEGNAGNDTLQGGNNTDTITYVNATGAVTVSLATTTSQNTVNDGSDTITTVENVTGSGFGDTLTGSTAANVLSGGAGADTVNGGDGADTLTGGAGADVLHGQNDNDSIDLFDSASDGATASDCGAGTDTALKDSADSVNVDCETVTIGGDTTAPTASLGGFTEVTGHAYQYASGSTMWVNPAQTGSFSVDVTATDSGSGMKQVEYPTLGTGWSPAAGNDTATPFTYVYTWSAAPASPGAKTAVARDNALNGTNVSFTVATDSAGPSGGTVSYLDGYTAASSVNVTLTPGSDASSGIASWQLQRRAATLTGTSCGTYGSWANIGSASPATPYADATVATNTCYQYQLLVTDNVGNTGPAVTSSQTLKIDRTAPTGLAVANISGNTRVDGVAVLTWTAATDSQSGIDHYEVKSWPDGVVEPADSEFRSTGSSIAAANVRIGVNPSVAPWNWKFKVRAVDVAGNTTASSSAAALTGASNQLTGTNADQSTTDPNGAGMRVGHATGNLSISNTDVSTKGYGVDLTVQRTFNHQNIQFQPVIGDTGWNNTPGPADTNSYTAQWAFGFSFQASFEQRLVSGDDGTDDGATDTLTFIDETGTNWPFIATAASATTYASPAGMSDATLVKSPSSTTYPTCSNGITSTYALRIKGGSTKCFDAKGRLLRETMRNGRSVSYTRNTDGRVSVISAEDPDGAGSEAPMTLTLSYNSDKRVSKVVDQMGRETRYDYVVYSGMYYLSSVAKYADSGSSTALTRTDYSWDANSSGRRINSIDEWVYDDDPVTGTSNDAVKHHWDLTYNSANKADTITESGSAARSVGSGSETIPAVAATVTTMGYVPLTSGGSAAALTLDVQTGTGANASLYGTWTYTLDAFGRALDVQKPLENGASARADVSTTFTATGKVATTTDERGDVTTATYNSADNTTRTEVDPAATGVPSTVTTFADHTALGDAATEVALRSPDGTFLAKWAYPSGACVDAGASGTFSVTAAGTSGSVAPTWPASGAVSSGTATFTKGACTPTPQGVTTLHAYDANGNEIQTTNADGVRTCTYFTATGDVDVSYKLDGVDCPGTPNTSTRIKGTLTDNSFNAKGFVTQTTTDDSTTTFSYNDAGQQTEQRLVVDSGDTTKDVVTSTTFDGAGRNIRETRTDEDGTSRSTSTGLTMTGDTATTTVPNAANPTGLSAGSPAGDVTSTRYNERGVAYLENRPDSTIVTRRRDGMNREAYTSVPHAASNAAPMATVVTYFLSGVKKTKADPAGITTTYDPSVTVPGADERPLKVDSPVSGVTTFTYDAQGSEATKTTSAGTFTYGYDGQGNLKSTTYPSGAVLVEIRDRRGNVVERRYTPSGGSAQVVTRTYTKDDKVLTEDQDSASGGLDTADTYNSSTGQLDKTVLDDGAGITQETRYGYDAAGRVSSQTLENGATDLTTTNVYENKSGRIKRTELPNGIDERYAYDEQGRVTELKAVKRSDSSWQRGDTYAYDPQGRITTRGRREGGTAYNTTYTYDPAGQVTSEASQYGIVRSYVYRDANNEDAFGTDLKRQALHVTTSPSGTLTLARVDQIESCLTLAASCGASDEAAIDAAIADFASPGSITDPSAATSTAADVARWLKLRDGTQSWEASKAYPVGTCIAPNGWQWERYEITTAGTSGTTQPSWPSSGTVTDGGVTWTKNSCTPELILREYTYDSGSPSKHQLVMQKDQIGVATYFHYDARGNQDYRGSVAYSGTPNQAWDDFNRPTQLINDAGQVVSLTWNADRFQLRSYAVNGLTRTLAFDEQGSLRKVVASGSQTWIVEYIWGRVGIEHVRTGGTTYDLITSKRGDVLALADSAGALSDAPRASVYGARGQRSTLFEKVGLGFDGLDGVVDLGEGLHWMRHRVFASDQARFISDDPQASAVGSLASRYNYADGDPVNQLDPSGLDCSLPIKSMTYLRYSTGPYPALYYTYSCNLAYTRRWASSAYRRDGRFGSYNWYASTNYFHTTARAGSVTFLFDGFGTLRCDSWYKAIVNWRTLVNGAWSGVYWSGWSSELNGGNISGCRR